MAHILLLDPEERARRAIEGILARGGHRLIAVSSPAEAWKFIRRNPCVDLVFTELATATGSGLDLISRLKQAPLLRYLPIVVYSGHADRAAVRRAIELRVQNFLVKPYHDDDVFREIDKAEASPWRDKFFEEEKSFCRLMSLTPDALAQQRLDLQQALVAVRGELVKRAALHNHMGLSDVVRPLRSRAEAAGAWGVAEALDQLTTHTAADRWAIFEEDLEEIDFAGRMVQARLNPDLAAAEFLGQAERDSETYRAERETWLAAAAASPDRVVDPAVLVRQVLALSGCPVIDNAAADFQMAANGDPACIHPIMDLVARDPGLSTQMLIAANRAHPSPEDFNRIEDARLAVGQLGELALAVEARNLVVLDVRSFNRAPVFTWPAFWTFQRGVARVSQLICRDLEFYSREQIARTAGQLHDIGKLLLAHVHPGGFQAILEYARVNGVPLRDAEQRFLGITTGELAARFGAEQGLSPRLTSVMRGIGQANLDGPDPVVIAIVSLARELCRHNQVGASGDPMLDHPLPLEETPEWAILSEGLYPSFDLRKFELQVHAYCGQLRAEFSGHESGTIAEIVARVS